MSEIKLKPCPSCGGEAYIDSYMDCGGEEVFCVTCSNCQLDGGRFISETDAIKHWNTRVERRTENGKV